MKTSNFFCNTLSLSIILLAVTPSLLVCMDDSFNRKRTYSQIEQPEQAINKLSITYLLDTKEELTKPTYVCKSCTKQFDDNHSLMSHYFGTINPNNTVTSLDASSCFKSIVYVENKCPICNHNVPKKRLWTHINLAHIAPSPVQSNYDSFECTSCTYRCTSKKMLYEHLSTPHHINVFNKNRMDSQTNIPKPALLKLVYVCKTCTTPFDDNHSLMNHYFPTIDANNNTVTSLDASSCFKSIVYVEQQCPICNEYVAKKRLWGHINLVHIGGSESN